MISEMKHDDVESTSGMDPEVSVDMFYYGVSIKVKSKGLDNNFDAAIRMAKEIAYMAPGWDHMRKEGEVGAFE